MAVTSCLTNYQQQLNLLESLVSLQWLITSCLFANYVDINAASVVLFSSFWSYFLVVSCNDELLTPVSTGYVYRY